jgi:hypothetical protein
MQAWPVKQRIAVLRDDSEKQASGLHPARSSPKAAPALQPRPTSPSKRTQPLVARVVDIDVDAHQADLLKADQLQPAGGEQPAAVEPAP